MALPESDHEATTTLAIAVLFWHVINFTSGPLRMARYS